MRSQGLRSRGHGWRWLVAAGVTCLAVVGGCAPSTPPAGEEDPALAAFYDQGLAWAACEDRPDLECASLTVPLDYAEPDGETVAMAVYRVPSRNEDAGPIVLLPGGPGGSGADLIADVIFRDLAGTHHLVSYDARAIGATSSIDCESDEDFYSRISLDATPDSPGEEDALLSDWDAVAAGCDEAAGAPLGLVGTRELVADLDVLRAALGEDALTLYGLSYGTLVGSEYVRAFPDSVARVALDAPVTAGNLADEESTEAVAAAAEAVLDLALADCFSRPLIPCRLGATPEEARASVERLMADLEETPVDLGERGILTRDRAVVTTHGYLSSGSGGWQTLLDALGRAAEGDWRYLANLDAQVFTPESGAMVITCADVGAPVAEVSDVRSTAQEWAATYPVFGEYLAWRALECSGWPVGPTLEVVTAPVESDAEILVVSSTGDPLTPRAFAEDMVEQMRDAPLLTYPGAEHVAYWYSDCVKFAVNDFLAEGTVPYSGACS